MYHYETLGDERFQEFCQALISASFPNAQFLPVGQPDGGRDAFLVQYFSQQRHRLKDHELIVFQVKYIKNPSDTRTEREMIEEVVKKEKKKIDNLKSAGLLKYYLITNLKGTAHPRTGSIDRVNELLAREFGVEAYCWWRDDLDRRLDANSSIKWSYPDILKATDLLEKLVLGLLGDNEERRRSAIRAYMTAQYNDDEELKFKQTELRSTMTNLFVDLPMRPSPDIVDPEAARTQGPKEMEVVQRRGSYLFHTDYTKNAAEFFIQSSRRLKLDRIVLEGAPGQGKSTITQYICQVMRMHFLDKAFELKVLPKPYQNVQVRIPFRVDLRDLAKWIAGIDPFQSRPAGLEDDEPRSLEGFLAGQIRFISGGHSFDVSDLIAVVRASHIILALDGFDEVADVALRQQLVDEITKGTNRLVNAGGYSVRTIVTSRPAAFAKSVQFPRKQWAYFELLPLERSQVDEYTVKWMRAKGLKVLEQTQLRRILDTKLRESHTQYLAKNPMQLTILLSLIHNRGASLPEKRTAMYDAYMDMFFSRESEKSDVVRDNRDLLIDIHRYLAWKLQTAAEAGDNGSIERRTLRATLFAYLDREGEDTSIVEALFNGIIERVGALVSRVQETYEFEVQPLREYFAARHLYETSPYPSADDEAHGDKFDRFNALIVNPYWLNVARFYGGCFNKGEILTLVNELVELGNREPHRLTSHPRGVALILLSDWVFTQYQPAVKRVVAFIGEYPQLRQLLAHAQETGVSYWSGLPERSGRSDLLEILWDRIGKAVHTDERQAIASAIAENSLFDERRSRWEKLESQMPQSDWARIGGFLRLFHGPNLDKIKPLNGSLNSYLIRRLIEARRFDFLEHPERFEAAHMALLHHVMVSFNPIERPSPGRLAWLATLCGYYQYGLALDESGVPLRYRLGRRFASDQFDGDDEPRKLHTDELPEMERYAVEAYMGFVDAPTALTATSTQPWAMLVEAMRRAWGDCAAIDRIAFVGAGVHSKSLDGSDVRLKDASDLVAASRFARLKSGAPRWWEGRLRTEHDPAERRRLLLLLSIWGTPKTLIKLSNFLDELLAEETDANWFDLSRDSYFILPLLGERAESTILSDQELASIGKLSPRVCTFVGRRLSQRSQFILALALASTKERVQPPEIQFALKAMLQDCEDVTKWNTILPYVKDLYIKGRSVRYSLEREIAIPDNIAKQICTDPESFPLSLVAAADNHLLSKAGASAPKLLEIARQERWFTDTYNM